MTPSGVYRCAGCKLLFTSIAEWRMGQPATDRAPDQQAIQNDHVARCSLISLLIKKDPDCLL
jgi:hypothetical protein